MHANATLNRLIEQIKVATERPDVAEIARLSKMAQRVQAIEAQMEALRQELQQIETAIGGNADAPVSAPSTSFDLSPAPLHDGAIVVEIDWAKCGVNRRVARISERKVSDTLVSFISEIEAALGPDMLIKLSAFKVSRGPLVSRNPQADYVNSKTGALYISHPVGHGGFYVLTHSGTPEKVAAIKDAWKFLGLNPAALAVRKNETQP